MIDIDDEREAMDWLDAAIGPASILRDDNRHRATIKRLLAEPRMPEELPPEVVLVFSRAFYAEPDRTTTPYARVCAGYAAARAALMEPPPKTIDVWHVEYVALNALPAVQVVAGTREQADGVAKATERYYSHVRVTGPHKHVVPA